MQIHQVNHSTNFGKIYMDKDVYSWLKQWNGRKVANAIRSRVVAGGDATIFHEPFDGYYLSSPRIGNVRIGELTATNVIGAIKRAVKKA